MCSVHACHTFLSKCPVFDHACCLPPVRQTGRLAGCSVPIPPWVGIAGSAFSNRRYGYRALWVHFGLARFFMAIPTENEGTGERGERRERRTESAARQSAFLRDHIGFVVFSAGSPLGAARPQTCAKESLTPWTLFIWVVMWVRFTRRRALGDNEDLTGLRSFCACHTFRSECPAFDHACCLTHSAKQDGLRCVPFLFRRGS